MGGYTQPDMKPADDLRREKKALRGKSLLNTTELVLEKRVMRDGFAEETVVVLKRSLSGWSLW